MTEELSTVVYEQTGVYGTGRLTVLKGELSDPDRALDSLRAGGCCAWKGRKRCGVELKPDSPVTFGHSNLLFLGHTAVGPVSITPNGDLAMVSFFCERHQEDPTLDMPRALRRQEEKARDKFIEMGGRKDWFGF